MNTATSLKQLTLPERVKDLVKQVVEKVTHDFGTGVQVIWFGSWMTGTAHPNSDIDLAISSPQPISAQDFAILRNWIDDLPTLFSIDLINLNEASTTLISEIRRHGIIIK